MKEQAAACMHCFESELIKQDSYRLHLDQWPAWTPGLQPSPCPYCCQVAIWATEDREEVGA